MRLVMQQTRHRYIGDTYGFTSSLDITIWPKTSKNGGQQFRINQFLLNHENILQNVNTTLRCTQGRICRMDKRGVGSSSRLGQSLDFKICIDRCTAPGLAWASLVRRGLSIRERFTTSWRVATAGSGFSLERRIANRFCTGWSGFAKAMVGGCMRGC